MLFAIIQSILVYGLLTVVMYAYSKKSYRYNKNGYMTIAILLYAIVFGLRYCVGVDYMGYVEMFEKVEMGYEVEKEYAFIGLMKIFQYFGLGVEPFFALCAFFQLFFIFQIFKEYKEIYPFLVITFMIGGEWLIYSNIIRNMFAFAIVAYSLRYIQTKSLYKHYFWLFIAFFFHKSCAIMLVVYPLYLLRPVFFQKRALQYGLLILSLVLMNINYIQEFVTYMDRLMVILGYADKYGMDERMDMDVSIGMGFVIELAIACTIIFYSPKIKEYYSNLPTNIMYDLFFVGLLIKYSFIGSMLIQRMNTYFIGYTFILAAMELAYLHKHKMKMGMYAIIGLYCMLGFAILYRMNDNSAMFIFNFQKHLLYLKNEFI